MRLKPGDVAPSFEVTDLAGVVHRLDDYRDKRLLLSFHRYAACPLCNLHIHELAKEYETLRAGGLSLLAIFMSGPDRLADQYESRSVPFPIAADPEQKMYKAYGVEFSVVGMLKADVAALRRADRGVAGGGRPRALLVQQHDALVPDRGDPRDRVVRRAVVGDDDLVVRAELGQHRVEARADGAGPVAHRNDHAVGRAGHGRPPSSSDRPAGMAAGSGPVSTEKTGAMRPAATEGHTRQ